MKAVIALIASAVCAGCGRIDIDAGAPRMLDASADTAALPAQLVCDEVTIPVPAVAPNTDLAVYRSSRGIDALWAGGGPVMGVALNPQLVPAAPPRVVIDEGFAGVAGLIDTGVKVLAVTTVAGGGQAVWSLATDLGSPVKLREEPSLASREPFASDVAQKPRIWLRGTPSTLVGAFISDDGILDVDGSMPTGGPVTSISMEDGPDHSHVTWTEDLGGGLSRCFASDVRYGTSPPLPSGGPMVSDDCHDVRTASGPSFADSMIVVWETAGHLVEARYLASTGDIMRDMSLHGRKPKVRFDGTEFWIAWIDEAAGDQLHLASFDLSGNVKDVGLPGWTPVGDEAFELVQRGSTVYLVILSRDTLSFLRTCT
ncbi:MAG TPA: hypothetical protein VFK02_08170 [Kofleriaceae bacterium]|nr:hypothetical protein [Kofleriaceae bacterium]